VYGQNVPIVSHNRTLSTGPQKSRNYKRPFGVLILFRLVAVRFSSSLSSQFVEKLVSQPMNCCQAIPRLQQRPLAKYRREVFVRITTASPPLPTIGSPRPLNVIAAVTKLENTSVMNLSSKRPFATQAPTSPTDPCFHIRGKLSTNNRVPNTSKRR